MNPNHIENNRLTRLYSLLKSHSLDALALNPGPTLTYLTGLSFHLMERPIVLIIAPPAAPVIVLPELETGKLRNALIPLKSIPYNDNPATWPPAFDRAAQMLGLGNKRVGIDPLRLRVLELRFLQSAAPGAAFDSAESMLSELRLCKTADEVDAIRKAAQIAQKALEAIIPLMKPGISEHELCAELLIQLFRNGADAELPFYPTVASGPNSADPHAGVSDRRIMKGDLLLIDWGASYQGYCADLTRTFAVGEPDPEMRTIYDLVLKANTAGRLTGKPGIAAGEVDQAARKVIQDGGFGTYFTHRTGHGIGMEIHEPPYIFVENTQVLQPGMVFTVEPGIYLPGKGGVRIEDDVLITDAGCESLTDFPRHLQVLE